MREKNYFKNCPKCAKEVGYKYESTRNRAVKLNSICRSCSSRIQQTGKTMSVQAKANISASKKGKPLSAESLASRKAYKKSVKDATTKMYGVKVKRNVTKHNKWAKQVKERDDYQCQCCGKEKTTPSSMHAHHIVPCEYFPHLTLDISNGITLCSGCHFKVHRDLDRITLTDIKLYAEGFVAHASNFINLSVPLSSSVLKEDDSNARA